MSSSGLESVKTSDLLRELIGRVDSIAQGITKAGQERPMQVGVLANGWGEIIDGHISASRGQELKARCLIGRHLISNCIKYYLMCMDDSHKLAQYRKVMDDMATAYAHFVRTDDAEASAQEKARSQEHVQVATQSIMSSVFPVIMGMWMENRDRDFGDMLSTIGVDSKSSGLDDLWRSFSK